MTHVPVGSRPEFRRRQANLTAYFCGSSPVWWPGHSKAAARRAGRLGDGFFPARGASPELIDLVRRTAEERGRDPDAIEITASLPEDLDTIPELAARGVGRLLVPVLPMFGVAGIINSIDEVAPWADTIDKYRDL